MNGFGLDERQTLNMNLQEKRGCANPSKTKLNVNFAACTYSFTSKKIILLLLMFKHYGSIYLYAKKWKSYIYPMRKESILASVSKEHVYVCTFLPTTQKFTHRKQTNK